MRRALLAASALTALLTLCACDLGKTDQKKGPNIEARLEKAEGAMQAAKEKGADRLAPREFQAYLQKLEDAKALIEEEKPEKASPKLASAASGFQQLLTQLEDIEKLRTSALAPRKQAEQAVTNARKKQWDLGSQEIFNEVKKIMDQAQADFDSGDRSKLQSLPRSYSRVEELVQRARERSQENKKYKELADVQKKGMLEAQGKAVEAKAPEHAAEFIARAQQTLREADVEYQNGNFREAHALYKTGENIFLEAMSYAKGAQELGNTPPQPAAAAAAAPAVADAPTPAPEPKDQRPPPEVVPGVEGVRKGEELSPEDEEFLLQNYVKFCSKVSCSFDPVTGNFSVDYPFGDEMRRDLLYPRGPVNPLHLSWKAVMGGMSSKEAGGAREGGVTFHGNTNGFFLLPFPFKDQLTLEFRIELMMMKPDGALSAIFMSSPNGKDYYAANFCTLEVWRDGKRVKAKPPNDLNSRRSPNLWFPKTKLAGVAMKIVYEPSKENEKEAQVAVWYDLDEASDDDKPFTTLTVPARGGQVGFSWAMTKFHIRQLKISGKLDKQAAVKFLRAKLGQAGAPAKGGGLAPKGCPRAKPKSEKQKPGDLKEGAAEENGADPETALKAPAPKPKGKKKPTSPDGEEPDY